MNERGKDKSFIEVIVEKKNNRLLFFLDIINVEERNEKNFEDNLVKKWIKIFVKKLKVK